MSGYAACSDPGAGIAVWACIEPTVTLAEWSGHLDDVREVRGWPQPSRRPCVLIYLIDSRFVPNGVMR